MGEKSELVVQIEKSHRKILKKDGESKSRQGIDT